MQYRKDFSGLIVKFHDIIIRNTCVYKGSMSVVSFFFEIFCLKDAFNFYYCRLVHESTSLQDYKIRQRDKAFKSVKCRFMCSNFRE